MDRVIENAVKIADTEHECNACAWLLHHHGADLFSDLIDNLSLSDVEAQHIKKARANDWKIQKGDKYNYCRGVYDGLDFEARSIPEINDICIKYDLYPEF